MKINVNGGHCPKSPGASGYLDELTEDRKVKDALIRILRERGNEVSDSTSNAANQSEDLAYQARTANESGAELAISIHFNAGGGTGPEVWYYTGSKKSAVYASKISSALAEVLGLRNRGAKHNTTFYWLRKTNMPALIVETCFVDTKADADAYRKVGPEAVAKAIADAIVGEPAADAPQTPQNPDIDALARKVIDGEYGNGEARRKALGALYDRVQERVNEILAGETSYDLDAVARAVINGDYGNGAERVQRLKAKGYDAAAVQARVNEILRT